MSLNLKNPYLSKQPYSCKQFKAVSPAQSETLFAGDSVVWVRPPQTVARSSQVILTSTLGVKGFTYFTAVNAPGIGDGR
jgi:hypothetical protein